MKIKRSELIQLANKYIGNDSLEAQNQILLKIATARAARLSYMNFDGEIDYEKDIQLHDRLLADGHASPFEHVSRCLTEEEYYSNIKGNTKTGYTENSLKEIRPLSIDKNSNIFGWCNNLRGFISYRYLIEYELI